MLFLLCSLIAGPPLYATWATWATWLSVITVEWSSWSPHELQLSQLLVIVRSVIAVEWISWSPGHYSNCSGVKLLVDWCSYLLFMLLLRVCNATPSSMQHFHATPSSVQLFLATPSSWPGVSSQFSGRATPLGMWYTPLSFYLIPPMSEGENYSAFAV